MAAPYVKNLIISGGADFKQPLTFSNDTGPTDFSGYTIKSQLRKNSATSSFKEFTVTITNPTSGEIELFLSKEHTSDLKPGRYVYDVLATRPNGDKLIVLEGTVNVRAGFSTNCP